jgi:hypothetical protein
LAARRTGEFHAARTGRRLGKPESFALEYERGQRRIDLVRSGGLGVDAFDLFAEIAGAAGLSCDSAADNPRYRARFGCGEGGFAIDCAKLTGK